MRCFGVRPTVDNGPPLLETYILDFAQDIYGRRIEVEFTSWLRPELKFDGLPALKTAMAKDIADAREVWERRH
jgi:riboflavin kinase/FMN adenylyltransferase